MDAGKLCARKEPTSGWNATLLRGNARAWMLLRLIEPRDRLIGCGEARSLLPVLNSIALRDLN